jgi:hypothetical protein
LADYIQWSQKDQVCGRTGKTTAYVLLEEIVDVCKWGRKENKMPEYEKKTKGKMEEIKGKVKNENEMKEK